MRDLSRYRGIGVKDMWRKIVVGNLAGRFVEQWTADIKAAGDLGAASKASRKALETTSGTAPIVHQSVDAAVVRRLEWVRCVYPRFWVHRAVHDYT